MIENSITKSKRIIGNLAVRQVEGSMTVPNLKKIASFEDLRQFRITQMESYSTLTLGFRLNDGQTCKAGSYHDFTSRFIFESEKKITRIEHIIQKNETIILRINFYNQQQRLVKVGCTDDSSVADVSGRREVFEIAEDEQLIGCKIDQN